uniref:Ethylene-responsive transcription factor ERF118-like n=1 Tax=Tanacetum cinerariifolium TaxID=118510 RepID=A0A6L2M4R3_TANCI|nr:ethylene-responsive transcription factor ERF118-like [Tanacetum cinerariifolium]
MAENQENVSNKKLETSEKVVPTKQNNQTRNVRIILHDPDMTDDSSDDEANKRPKSKTIVREIKMPMVTFSDTNETSQNSNDGMRNLGKKQRGLTRTSSQPKSNNALDEDLLPDRGLIMDPNEMTLEDAGKDLDLGTMELGASFLDCFDDALNGFGNVDDFNLCGFDEKMTSDLPDRDFGEFDDEERAWFDALELGEQQQQALPMSFAASF